MRSLPVSTEISCVYQELNQMLLQEYIFQLYLGDLKRDKPLKSKTHIIIPRN